MENKEIASYFKLCGQLMELHEENKFKVRSYTNAAFQMSRFGEPIEEMDPDYYGSIPGVGKSMIQEIEDLLDTGKLPVLEEWIAKTPNGVIEMLGIKGIGPSKVRTIWKDMEIESPGELLYACNENRLIELKGFGEKTQTQVKAAIEFMLDHKHQYLYASVEGFVDDVIEEFNTINTGHQIAAIEGLGRKTLLVNAIEFGITQGAKKPKVDGASIEVSFREFPQEQFEIQCFQNTAKQEHLDQLNIDPEISVSENYTKNGYAFIPVEMREGHQEFEWAKTYQQEDLISDNDLKGCLHNHSTYSDGVDTLESMARHLKNEGYEYFGICDHSQTAVYAGGLNPYDVEVQHREIDALNAELKPFKIFKGIESDILSDGSLDYEEDVLRSFDFIVASVHSAMKMDEAKATQRLIRAIENPYTKILGHPTGRLLLSRPGYPIDHKKIIDACAANGVSMELNANPMRLDIDWRWIPYCMEKEVLVSINPDAHRISGFEHMRYGVMAARKGGLTRNQCLNALGLKEIEAVFAK
ncbi:MAG: DNA polymerase/3'-5' exonuclease PolX [Salibacteraceae bacterium]